MASRLIGRTKCPECGFESAHVKLSDKGTVYRYCPNHDCGSQHFPRGQAARSRLLAASRLVDGAAQQLADAGIELPAGTGTAPAAPAPATPAASDAGTGTGAGSGPLPVAADLAVSPPPAPRRRALGFF